MISTSVSRNHLLVALFVTFFVAVLTVQAKTSAEPVTLNFNSLNVVPGSCTGGGAPGGWTGGKPESGTYVIPPNTLTGDPAPGRLYTFTFTCTGASGTTYAGTPITASAQMYIALQAQVNVSFGAPGSANPYATAKTLTMNASPTYVTYGKNYSIDWAYSDPYGTCTLNGSPVSTSGSKSYTNGGGLLNYCVWVESGMPSLDTVVSYTVKCTTPGIGSIEQTRTVTVRKGLGAMPKLGCNL